MRQIGGMKPIVYHHEPVGSAGRYDGRKEMVRHGTISRSFDECFGRALIRRKT